MWVKPGRLLRPDDFRFVRRRDADDFEVVRLTVVDFFRADVVIRLRAVLRAVTFFRLFRGLRCAMAHASTQMVNGP